MSDRIFPVAVLAIGSLVCFLYSKRVEIAARIAAELLAYSDAARARREARIYWHALFREKYAAKAKLVEMRRTGDV
jgi:hypothetical protein